MKEEEIENYIYEKFVDVVLKNKSMIMKIVMFDMKGKANEKAISQVAAELCK